MQRTFFSLKEIDSFFDEAYAWHKQGKLSEAEERYVGMLNLHPDNVAVLFLLATLYMQQHKNGLAIQLFNQCERLKPNQAELFINRGAAYRNQHMLPQARQDYQRALELIGKEHASTLSNLGASYVTTGEPQLGIPFSERAIAADPEHPGSHWNYSLLLLEQGDLINGFREYEWGLKSKDRNVRNFSKDGETPWWDGRPDQNLVAYGEQGLGDEIIFAKALDQLCDVSRSVILETNPRLAALFRRSFPRVTVYGTRKQDYIDWPANHQIDARVATGSLPKFFWKEFKDIPQTGFLKADSEKSAHYRDQLLRLGNKPKIGLSWLGGIQKTRLEARSMPLAMLKEIFTQDATFVSLQYTPNSELYIADVEKEFGVTIHQFPEAMGNTGADDDYDITAALVSQLDLVITVATSVAHLAAGLDVPVWLFNSHARAWREFSPDGRTSPFYPQWTLYQQGEDFNWKPIISRMAQDLREWLALREMKTQVATA